MPTGYMYLDVGLGLNACLIPIIDSIVSRDCILIRERSCLMARWLCFHWALPCGKRRPSAVEDFHAVCIQPLQPADAHDSYNNPLDNILAKKRGDLESAMHYKSKGIKSKNVGLHA